MQQNKIPLHIVLALDAGWILGVGIFSTLIVAPLLIGLYLLFPSIWAVGLAGGYSVVAINLFFLYMTADTEYLKHPSAVAEYLLNLAVAFLSMAIYVVAALPFGILFLALVADYFLRGNRHCLKIMDQVKRGLRAHYTPRHAGDSKA